MTIQRQTSKEYFKSLTLVHLALLIGPLFFALMVFYLNSKDLLAPQESLRLILIIVVLIFLINGVAIGQIIYKIRLQKLKASDNLFSKMSGYRSALIIRLALVESASFFSIVSYVLTADMVFLVLTGVILIYFYILKPSREKVVLDLELNASEKMKIEDDNVIIAEFEFQNK